MTPDQMIALGTAFAAYLRIFEVCVAYSPTAEHLHSYCRGLLSDLKRKSVEPMANACGTAVRTLQEFLRDHVWDQLRMRDLSQQRLLGLPALMCEALNQRCRTWQRNRRGTTEIRYTAGVIEYHQQRNRAARISRQKQRTPLLM